MGKQQKNLTATLSQQSNNIILYQDVGYRWKDIVGKKYFTNKDMLAGVEQEGERGKKRGKRRRGSKTFGWRSSFFHCLLFLRIF